MKRLTAPIDTGKGDSEIVHDFAECIAWCNQNEGSEENGNAIESASTAMDLLKSGAGKGKGNKVIWTERMDAKLGTKSDLEIGRELGLGSATVGRRRDLLGIPICGDVVSGKSPHSRWAADIDAMLGTKSDSEVAVMLGISPAAVTKRRTYLGIPRYVSDCTTRKPKIQFTPEIDALLGTVADRTLARHLGILSVNPIRKRRKILGIEPFNR